MKLFEVLVLQSLQDKIWSVLNEDARTDFVVNNMRQQLSNVTHDQQARGRTAEDIVDTLKQADPTQKKAYLQFLAKLYTKGQFRLEDVARINKELTLYDKIKPKLPVEQRNILSFQKLSDLYNVLKPFESPEQDTRSNREVKKENKLEGAKVIIDTPNFKVYEMLTEAACKLYGKGTKWCTAGDQDNQFDNYHKQGAIYVIMAGDRKFQLQMESDQFMEEHDLDIQETGDVEFLSKFPQYTEFLNMLIKKYYMS